MSSSKKQTNPMQNMYKKPTKKPLPSKSPVIDAKNSDSRRNHNTYLSFNRILMKFMIVFLPKFKKISPVFEEKFKLMFQVLEASIAKDIANPMHIWERDSKDHRDVLDGECNPENIKKLVELSQKFTYLKFFQLNDTQASFTKPDWEVVFKYISILDILIDSSKMIKSEHLNKLQERAFRDIKKGEKPNIEELKAKMTKAVTSEDDMKDILYEMLDSMNLDETEDIEDLPIPASIRKYLDNKVPLV